MIESALARIYILHNEPEKIEDLLTIANTWNNPEFRRWLVRHQNRPNYAAKLAVIAGSFEEAFNIWEQMYNEKHIDNDGLNDCFQTLSR